MLAYPERRLSLVSDGKPVFQSTGSGKLYDVLVKVYGLEMAREMLAVETRTNGRTTNDDVPSTFVHRPSSFVVTGYIGSPSLHRGNRSYITLFVNRRWFQDTSIAYSVIQAYHTMLPVGRYPVAAVFIEIPPEEVDVNVHPTKAEVRFRESGAVFSAVQKAVRRTLTELAPIPQVAWEARPPAVLHRMRRGSAARGCAPIPFGGSSWSERREALLGAGSEQRRLFHASRLGSQTPPPGRVESRSGRGRRVCRGTASRPLSHHATLMPLLRVVGQLGATYIVAEGPDGMYLIDQHAAHERVLYEQMLAEHDDKPAGAPTAAGAAGARLQPGASGRSG